MDVGATHRVNGVVLFLEKPKNRLGYGDVIFTSDFCECAEMRNNARYEGLKAFGQLSENWLPGCI